MIPRIRSITGRCACPTLPVMRNCGARTRSTMSSSSSATTTRQWSQEWAARSSCTWPAQGISRPRAVLRWRARTSWMCLPAQDRIPFWRSLPLQFASGLILTLGSQASGESAHQPISWWFDSRNEWEPFVAIEPLGRQRSRRPLAEDRRADADVGGPQLDGDLVVGAHPHAQVADPMAARDLREQGEMKRRLVVCRRNAHEADHRELQFVAA